MYLTSNVIKIIFICHKNNVHTYKKNVFLKIMYLKKIKIKGKKREKRSHKKENDNQQKIKRDLTDN